MRNKIWDKYKRHRDGALYRGIGFEFEFEEWVEWWVKNAGPNWEQIRGRKAHELCMARKNDTGPYSPDNVRCVTNNENHRERENKLTRQKAREIFVSTESFRELSRRYNVNRTIIRRIKKQRNWAEATADLGRPGRSELYNINGRVVKD